MFFVFVFEEGGGVNCYKVNIYLFVYNIILMLNNGYLVG